MPCDDSTPQRALRMDWLITLKGSESFPRDAGGSLSMLVEHCREAIDEEKGRQSNNCYQSCDHPRSPIRSWRRSPRAFWVRNLHRLAFLAGPRRKAVPWGKQKRRPSHAAHSERPQAARLVNASDAQLVLWAAHKKKPPHRGGRDGFQFSD